MDSQNCDILCRSPYCMPVANWTIVDGSVENTIAYESFYSPINDEETVASSSPKSPLLLRLPYPDSAPCEITIHFMEKHEIRQVYVRSTARVYEIYCANNSQNKNEYLCTVRCGAAKRDEELLHATGIEDAPTRAKGPDRDAAEGKLRSGSNLNTNEDGWVEVKVPDSPALDSKDISSLATFSADTLRLSQNFYEATAEITDADPCTSLTIRLLSLQNKSCVCVDEVYVFANPVDLEEDRPVENSAKSSLMSMLVPTLLQLSKTSATKKNDDEHTSNVEGTSKIVSKASESINNLTGLQEEGKPCATDSDEVKVQETNESDRAVSQSEATEQVPFKESKHDEPLHRIENLLDNLVSRMDRMENCFLRFEENMIKPINSIEERLKNVEQQLEVLTKEPPRSELHSCYRMSAPVFSGTDSASNSFYNSGNDRPSCGPIEPDRTEIDSGASSIALEDTSNFVSSSLLRPGLVVTAPEFSNGDDEEDQKSLEISENSLESKPKPSIDDVLASVLARFASSCSINTPYTETAVIRAPEFLDEDDGEDFPGALSIAPSEIELDHINCFEKIDDTENMKNSPSVSPSSAICGNLSSSNDDFSSKFAVEDEQVHGQIDDGTSEDCISKKIDSPIYPIQNTNNDPDTTEVDAAEVTKEGCAIDIVHDVLGFSRDMSVVNFEIPILDVNFASISNSNSENTLKDLLGDMPGLDYGASCVKESDEATPICDECDLILVEEEDRVVPAPTNGHLSVDMNYYSIMDEPLVADGENLQDHCPCSSHSTIIASLI